MEDEYIDSYYEGLNDLPDDGAFDEFNDQDATDCANGDYNTWEENEVFHDNEGAE